MKFLWVSNAPWSGTGYGVQTKLLLKALQEKGHEPHCFAFYGLHGNRIQYDGYTVWPNSDFEAYGNDVIEAHVQNSHAEAIITLMDVFVLDSKIWGRIPQPWVAWLPIDTEGIGYPNLERLGVIDHPVAMSLHGKKQLEQYGFEPDMIYHAVDTFTYRPIDKWECRREFGIEEDCYLIGMVMANKGDRKQYPQQLHAIKRWMDEHDDRNIKVYLHTDPTMMMGGWDMKELVALMGLKGKVYASNQYFTSVCPLEPEQMARLYNTMDVLMNVSAGEGFGIPIVEAQACGVPVITQDVTSMPEITHNGYAVKSAARGLASTYGWQFGPDVEDIVYRLESVYRMTDSSRRAMGRQWTINNCSVEAVASQWDQLLRALEEKLAEGIPVPEKVSS